MVREGEELTGVIEDDDGVKFLVTTLDRFPGRKFYCIDQTLESSATEVQGIYTESVKLTEKQQMYLMRTNVWGVVKDVE